MLKRCLSKCNRFFRRFFFLAIKVGLWGLLLLIVLGLWEIYLASGGHQIGLSQQTTWIVEPIREDGYPDYVKALELEFAEGKQPDKNCVIPLVELIGPEFLDDAGEFYSKLGIQPPEESERHFKSWYDYLRSLENTPAHDRFEMARNTVRSEVWSRDEFPEVVKWIEHNEQTIPQIEAIANYSQYHYPFTFINGENAVENILLPPAGQIGFIGHFLMSYGLLAIGENEYDKAAKASELLIKLSCLVDQGPTAVEGMIANLLRTCSFDIEVHLASRADWSEAKIQQRLEFFQSYPPQLKYVERMNYIERFMALDAVRLGVQGKLKLNNNPLGNVDQKMPLGPKMFAYLDVEHLYASINQRMDEITSMTDPAQPINLTRDKRIEVDHFLHHLFYFSKFEIWTSMMRGRKARSRFVADVLIGTRVTDMEEHADSEMLRLAQHRIIQLGWSIRLFHRNQQRWPGSLDELANMFSRLDVNNPFTNERFDFRRQDNRLEVYSRGANHRDDTHPELPDSGYQYLSENSIQDVRKRSDDVVVAFDLSKDK